MDDVLTQSFAVVLKMLVLASAGVSDLVLVPGLAVSAAIFAQLIAVPVAWLKLRRTAVWADRPGDVRSLDLLVAFSGRPVVLGAVFGAIVGLGIWIGMLTS